MLVGGSKRKSVFSLYKEKKNTKGSGFLFPLQFPFKISLSISSRSLFLLWLNVSVIVCVWSRHCADCLQAAFVERRGKASERRRERDAEGAQKTTLSKEGFKDYQLRLLGNLRSCILSTSKGRCVLEYCKWESEGWVGGGEGWRRRRRGESDFSNKCWHQACLILDSGNSLICYRLWNSPDVLQRGSLTATTPRAREESRERQARTTVQL